ncbi:hypothetical protein DAMA08_049850 [Martiniozyma asiatica (nom. inval.)]|nr:hypothetical protein DAMA08_049850 [Martiniozyma asiatica]
MTMDTQQKLLLLQILFASKTKDFGDLALSYNEHALSNQTIKQSEIPKLLGESIAQYQLTPLPSIINTEYFFSDEGAANLIASCEGYYDLRVQEIENQISKNKDTFQQKLSEVN